MSGAGNPCHDDKGKFCGTGSSADHASDTRADQPATTREVTRFTDSRHSESSAHAQFEQTRSGKRQAIAEAKRVRELGFEAKVLERNVMGSNADLRSGSRGLQPHGFYEVHVLGKKK